MCKEKLDERPQTTYVGFGRPRSSYETPPEDRGRGGARSVVFATRSPMEVGDACRCR